VFRWGTLVALLPTLMLAEMLAWGYVLLRGADHVRSKARSYVWIIKNRCQIAEARRQTQALRRVKDRQLLHQLSHRLTFAETTNRHVAAVLEAVVQLLLWIWGQICRAVVAW